MTRTDDHIKIGWKVHITDAEDNNDGDFQLQAANHIEASNKAEELRTYLKKEQGWIDPVVMKLEEGDWLYS